MARIDMDEIKLLIAENIVRENLDKLKNSFEATVQMLRLSSIV